MSDFTLSSRDFRVQSFQKCIIISYIRILLCTHLTPMMAVSMNIFSILIHKIYIKYTEIKDCLDHSLISYGLCIGIQL